MGVCFTMWQTDTLTLDQLREATQIPEHELRRHVMSLCTPRHKILKKASKVSSRTSQECGMWMLEHLCRMERENRCGISSACVRLPASL